MFLQAIDAPQLQISSNKIFNNLPFMVACFCHISFSVAFFSKRALEDPSNIKHCSCVKEEPSNFFCKNQGTSSNRSDHIF